MRHYRLVAILVCLGFVPTGACKSTTPTSSTIFQGVIAASNGQTGTLTVTLDTQVVNASGSVHVAGGGTTSLTGTYDSNEKTFSLSGSGFNFSGSVSSGVIKGLFTGPNGTNGLFSGRTTTGGTVTVYCGAIFSAGQSQVQTGVFNMAVTDSTGVMSGAFNAPPNAGYMTGQVTGTTFTMSYTDSTTGESGTGSGTIQNGAMSGTSSGNNPFSGSTSKCQ